jgi:hypothetical protein
MLEFVMFDFFNYALSRKDLIYADLLGLWTLSIVRDLKRWTESRTAVNLSAIHHHQNPVDPI